MTVRRCIGNKVTRVLFRSRPRENSITNYKVLQPLLLPVLHALHARCCNRHSNALTQCMLVHLADPITIVHPFLFSAITRHPHAPIFHPFLSPSPSPSPSHSTLCSAFLPPPRTITPSHPSPRPPKPSQSSP